MRVGTRTVLWGDHQFAIHPWFVAAGWWQLYGLPWDPRLWLAFWVHDLGYLGKPDLDGPEGERHPELGARIMGRLFGRWWYDLTLLHSRFYCLRLGRPISRLCLADKQAIVLLATWLYLRLAYLSGELAEYLEACVDGKYADHIAVAAGASPAAWHREVQAYLRAWITAHRDQAEVGWARRDQGPCLPKIDALDMTRGAGLAEAPCAHGLETAPCTVLDPFAGSGTTLAVARRLGRRGVSVEIQAAYLPLIRRRVSTATLPLLEQADGHGSPTPASAAEETLQLFGEPHPVHDNTSANRPIPEEGPRPGGRAPARQAGAPTSGMPE
jgi:hypothetical protein